MGEDKNKNESTNPKSPAPKKDEGTIKDDDLKNVAGGLTQDNLVPGDGLVSCC